MTLSAVVVGPMTSWGERLRRLQGGRWKDVVSGGLGGDYISGGSRANVLYGGSNRDFSFDGPGKDRVETQRGKDFIRLEMAGDRVSAGLGSDAGLGNVRLAARGARFRPRFVDCGPGIDKVRLVPGRSPREAFLRLALFTTTATGAVKAYESPTG